MPYTPAILFVDETNTFASPVAAALFQQQARFLGLEVDAQSAGISRECAGEAPPAAAAEFARAKGVDISAHRARQLRLQDIRTVDHIVALDRRSFAFVRQMCPPSTLLTLIDDHTDRVFALCISDLMACEGLDLSTIWEPLVSASRGLAGELGPWLRPASVIPSIVTERTDRRIHR